MAGSIVTEEAKMRKVPGIGFRNGAAGRRACVAGTSIDVWMVVRQWLLTGRDMSLLRQAYDWLPLESLQAALRYYELYPQEIDRWLEDYRDWTPEQVAASQAEVRNRRTNR